MNTAENIQILLDGGYRKQAVRMANNVDNPTVYTFADNSFISIIEE